MALLIKFMQQKIFWISEASNELFYKVYWATSEFVIRNEQLVIVNK